MPMSTPEEQRDYQNKWIQRRRMEWILENGPCVDCGRWTDDLEVDHEDASTKLLNPRSLWGMSPSNPKRIDELAKCVVRCHEDHVKKTKERREYLYGENNPNAKLTNEQVKEIRKRYVPRTVSLQMLAYEYGVDKRQIHRIVNRESYKNI